jgi:hypothetical protein
MAWTMAKHVGNKSGNISRIEVHLLAILLYAEVNNATISDAEPSSMR